MIYGLDVAITTVLFDMNGVIVDDESLHEQAFKKVLESINVSLTSKDYVNHFIGRTDKDGFVDFLTALKKDFDQNLIKELIFKKGQAYQQLAQDNLTPYPGVIDFIQTLFEAGLNLGLVTSSTRFEAETVLATLGVDHFFSKIVTADDIKIGKPNPEGYLKGASFFHAPAKNCLVVEDAPSGIKAAKKAGMKTLAVTNTHSQLSDADIILSSLNQDSLAWLIDQGQISI